MEKHCKKVSRGVSPAQNPNTHTHTTHITDIGSLPTAYTRIRYRSYSNL